MINKIISGGQTGIDRAALDVCLAFNISHGGWCPKGRKAEDGVIPAVYQLVETESDDYSERTKANIRDATATLIIVPSLPLRVTDGTVLSIEHAQKLEKPYYLLALYDAPLSVNEALLLTWLRANNVTVLNVAGPRESQSPGIYNDARVFLEKVMAKIYHPYPLA